MSVFDLKNATVRLVDGRLGTLTTTAAAGVNGEIILTDINTHHGTNVPTITIVNAGVSHLTLDVAVDGNDITVTPITNGSSVITSTANAVISALQANAAAAALCSFAPAGTGASAVSAQVKTALGSPARVFTVKVAEGMISYNEKRPIKYIKDRGKLDDVLLGDEEPMEVKIDGTWSFITGVPGSGLPQFEDIFKQRGEAATWVTTDPDPCKPYCIDIEVEFDPLCNLKREFTTLTLFRYEEIDHTFKDGIIKVSGKCNATQAQDVRAA